MFETTAIRQPKAPCLGWRPFDPVTKTFGPYQWIDYGTVQRRRAEFGAGLVELHNKHHCARPGQYGIGLWCQNRPEWQITGTLIIVVSLVLHGTLLIPSFFFF
jgi:long-chain acyl-CoA synthetase